MAQDSERGRLVHQAINLLIRSMRCHNRGIERMASETGLHQSQRMILLTLSRMDGAVSQRALADRFDISPSGVARSLKALAAEGYITRVGDADDQRRNQVSITDKGMQIVEETRRIFDRFDQQTFEGFQNEEIVALIALMDRVQNNLKQYEDADAPQCKKGRVSP